MWLIFNLSLQINTIHEIILIKKKKKLSLQLPVDFHMKVCFLATNFPLD